MDSKGNELTVAEQRLCSLDSLKIPSWKNAEQEHAQLVAAACEGYFERNPYRRWFDQLEFLISVTGNSYYWPQANACHLDLVPFATKKKWSEIDSKIRGILKRHGASTLANLLAFSNIEVLILNGRLVVDEFQDLFGVSLERSEATAWNLRRSNGGIVRGIAFEGKTEVKRSSGPSKSIKILGFNHNIQSSYGISKAVRESIRDWIAEAWKNR